MKSCRTCRQEKPLSDFYKRRKSHNLDCKKCENKKRHASRDREAYNASMREWRQKNPEAFRATQRRSHEKYKEKRNADRRKVRKADPEKFRQKESEWYHANREEVLRRKREDYHASPRQKEYLDRYVAENPEKTKAWAMKTSAKRKLAFDAACETIRLDTILIRDSGICGVCLKAFEADSKIELDHIFPLARGGGHTHQNVQVAHMACNRMKWAWEDYTHPDLRE